MEKADENTALDNWQYILEQAFSMLENCHNTAEVDEAASQISLWGCVALKTDKMAEAEQCFNKILMIDLESVSGEAYLSAVKNMLITIGRKRNESVFVDWLSALKIKLDVLAAQKQYKKFFADFYIVLTFSICDKRFNTALPLLKSMVLSFIKTTDDKLLQCFFSELTAIAAQFARRQWLAENRFLIKLLLTAIVKKHDLKLMQRTILQLNMNLQMYSRWDGFTDGLRVYKDLQYFLLLLIKRAGNEKIDIETRKSYLLLALRSTRDLIANVSRCSMQDDLDIIKEWHEFLLKEMAENLHNGIKLLVQLEIVFWNLTKPKTSRKQMEYLAELVEPSVIDDKYRNLLQNYI